MERCRSAWWLGYSLALFLPILTFVFFLTGPHGLMDVWAWALPVLALVLLDLWGPAERRTVPVAAPRWFFDGLLMLLGLIQLSNIVAMGFMVSKLSFGSYEDIWVSCANLVVLRVLAGTNACCSVIAPAHELIHRRSPWMKRMGRVMLMTVFYDHFYVVHRIGHHAHLGSHRDPSTARMDESYNEFFLRTLVQQFRTALDLKPHSVRFGFLVEVIYLMVYVWLFGPLAAFALVYIAVVAVRLLEAVNYFQHFGLTLDSGHATYTAWRCDKAVSLFMFLGLSRHADHHRRPGRTFTELQYVEEGPYLPYGYLGTAIWVKNASRSYRRWVHRSFAPDAAA